MSLGEYIGAGSGTTKLLLHLEGNANDTSGNSNNGTSTAITYSQANGKFGQGAGFNGTTSKVSISSDLGITGGNITQSIWVKIGSEISTGKYGLIYQFDTGNEVGYKIDYEYNSGTRTLYFIRIRQNQAFTGPTRAITLGTTNWYNFILTYDGTSVKGYINGELIGTTADSGNGSASGLGDLTTIGCTEGNVDFTNGSIDEVIVEATAWTLQQVQKYYSFTRGRFGL